MCIGFFQGYPFENCPREGLQFRAWGLWLRVQALGFRVWGKGLGLLVVGQSRMEDSNGNAVGIKNAVGSHEL